MPFPHLVAYTFPTLGLFYFSPILFCAFPFTPHYSCALSLHGLSCTFTYQTLISFKAKFKRFLFLEIFPITEFENDSSFPEFLYLPICNPWNLLILLWISSRCISYTWPKIILKIEAFVYTSSCPAWNQPTVSCEMYI